MYLVKSCHEIDNIWKRNTIKIGTLTEYRDTEEQQIADRYEGNIELIFRLNDVHLPAFVFNEMNTFSDASSDFYAQNIDMRSSPLIPNHVYSKKYHATGTMTKFNRFIFCLSELLDPKKCQGIFREYNDYWYFPRDRASFFGDLVSKSILTEVSARTLDGEKLFTTDIEQKPLEIRWYCNRIFYTSRKIHIDNKVIYTEPEKIIHCLSEGHMVKPSDFQHEKEWRFIFDIYCENKILQPLNKPLFISAENILPLIKR